MHGRVALADALGGRLDLLAVGDVADLGLGADLGGDLLEALRRRVRGGRSASRAR